MAVGTCALILLDGTGISGTVTNTIVADPDLAHAPMFHVIRSVPFVAEITPVLDDEGNPTGDTAINSVLMRVSAGWLWDGAAFSPLD